ncbi:unnamed protein product, partial [Polarella glacialis]
PNDVDADWLSANEPDDRGETPGLRRNPSGSSAEANCEVDVEADAEAYLGATIDPKAALSQHLEAGGSASQSVRRSANASRPSKTAREADLLEDEEAAGVPLSLLEAARNKRRMLRRQRAALEAEMEMWKQDVAATSAVKGNAGNRGSSHRRILTEVKAVLEERAVRIAEGIREARAVERLLTNWQPGSTTAPHTPAAAQSAPRGEWAIPFMWQTDLSSSAARMPPRWRCCSAGGLSGLPWALPSPLPGAPAASAPGLSPPVLPEQPPRRRHPIASRSPPAASLQGTRRGFEDSTAQVTECTASLA